MASTRKQKASPGSGRKAWSMPFISMSGEDSSTLALLAQGGSMIDSGLATSLIDSLSEQTKQVGLWIYALENGDNPALAKDLDSSYTPIAKYFIAWADGTLKK